ncbi:hypothetical protein XAC908_880005 [Xanthomonas citri pv. citri]|nr:hypothetical protein XAC908_880005 [Xanthomonas citri pv. citri]
MQWMWSGGFSGATTYSNASIISVDKAAKNES